jgi:hypothetical protein
MKKLLAVFAAGLILTLGFGCATKEFVDSRVATLEERIGKLEKAGAASHDADVKKAEEAAMRAETAAKKAEEAEAKAETAEKAAMASEKKSETAAEKAAKAFELTQKK